MFNQTEQFITQMKLHELRVQREHLLARYDSIAQEFAQQPDDPARLRYLYDALKNLKFAKQPLHPDTANLEVLLYESQNNTSDLLTFWLNRLQEELAAGRRRSEFIYIFGALLEDWAGQPAEDTRERDSYQAEALFRTTQPSTAFNLNALTAYAQDYDLNPPDDLKPEEREKQSFTRPVTAAELRPILQRLVADPYRSPTLRDEVRRFLASEALVNEFADALTIMLDAAGDWSWDSDGIPTRVVWMRRKWRLVLDEDLPTACMLEILASRLFAALNQRFLFSVASTMGLLQGKLRQPNPTLVDHERKTMQTALKPFKRVSGSIWSDTTVEINDLSDETILRAARELWGESYSLHYARTYAISGLYQRAGLSAGSYDADYGAGGMNDALLRIQGDIQLSRAAFPTKPVYLLKLDIEDFYPSIPHEVVLKLLPKMPDDVRVLIERFLRVPHKHPNGTVTTAVRGLPINCGLSHFLAEYLLRLLDIHLTNNANVQIIRVVDDIAILSTSAEDIQKAWRLLQDFYAACGLTFNTSKSGSVAVGGERPSGLPQSLPTWLLLQLHPDGEWRVDPSALSVVINQTRAKLDAPRSVIALVEDYNTAAEFVVNSVALDLPLGTAHRESINAAIAQFHYGDAQTPGITTRLRGLIHERFGATLDIPEGWLYFPITAGGLGLTQPLVDTARFGEPYLKRTITQVPQARGDDWLYKQNNWAYYYNLTFVRVQSGTPVQQDVMETLVKDFIQRGKKLSGGKQQSLSAYWRWILYTYGAQIIDYFGTFRFLITQLVPVQLILQKRRG